MDTRLKKFKYSLFTKFLCWFISAIAFSISFLIAFQVFLNCIAVGPSKYFKEDPNLTFFESDGFLDRLQIDFFSCLDLSKNNAKKLTEELNSQKKKVTNEVLNKFLDYKASVIEGELRYAVENWDDSYYNFDGDVDVSIPSEYNTKVYVDITDPESIQTAQKILVNAKGQEFLLYESLVRSEAFDDYFNSSYDIKLSDEFVSKVPDLIFDIQLNFNKAQAAEAISGQYDAYVRTAVENNYGVSLNRLSLLESRKNLKYYVVDFDGDIYSNINSIPKNLKNKDRYILANKGNYDIKGFVLSNFGDILEEGDYNTVCMYFDESFKEDDIYGRLFETFNFARSEKVIDIILCLLIALVIAIVMFVFWLRLNGRKADCNKTTLSFIDKIPTDLHLAVTVGIFIFFFVCLHDVLQFGTEYFDSFMYTKDFLIIIICVFVLFFMIFSEWLSSFIRIIKAEKSVVKCSFVYFVLNGIFKGISKGCHFVYRKIKELFSYKPKTFKFEVILGILLYFVANMLICFVLYLANYFTMFDGVVYFILVFCSLLLFNGVVGYFVVRYMNNLDKIIIASGERSKVDFEDSKVHSSLDVLAKNLENYNDALESAVDEAVKNEQMKAQLITNVSHDLKTPLTSLINYSDLLSKCDVTDETAVEYIGVINNQSAKLKRLIEDLIEASKASTGNVQINKTKLNLSELAVQAIVEFTPDFELNKNEIKFTEPESAPVVFADSVKTYRIISNLFSNAKKYSAKGTRVYASVYEDASYGYFEIKNISREPLNISPEVLTERFVRGDESRTKEGNGLGLSIAKDLCKLQDGELIIKIDGDLFKATVKLPKN